MATDHIEVRGARTHNLADIDVDLPRDRLVVITGVSGSGKSSLAFDTLFAEGQRRYVESLSVSARQFLSQLPRPDVDLIEGLSPTVALSQQTLPRNPRSTVGTASEVHDFLRLVYARVGVVHSHRSGAPMQRHTVDDMVDAIRAIPERAKFSVLAPVVMGQVGDHADRIADLRRQGFVRAAIDDALVDLADLPADFALDPDARHDIEVYVDRLVNKAGIESRLADSLEIALGLTGTTVKILPLEGEAMTFSSRFADPDHDLTYPEITPGLFSFNSPSGACPECDGLGFVTRFDPGRVVPDPSRSLNDGALRPLTGAGGRNTARSRKLLDALAHHLDLDLDAPWSSLPAEARVALLEGTGDEPVPGLGKKASPFEGVLARLRRKLAEAEQRALEGDGDDAAAETELRGYLEEATCPACEGQRLRVEARNVRVAGENIHELSARPLDELAPRLRAVVAGLDEAAREIAEPLIEQAARRVEAAVELGLGYLQLDRVMSSLSGGEAQRVRLATQIGSGLVGVTYVLDEPSVGLHQRDNERLIAMLRRLRDQGNGVIVVEHDADTIRAADHVVEMGPGAGERGGRVVAQGPLDGFLDHPRSLTAGYLSGRMVVPRPDRRRCGRHFLHLGGARGHNLRDVDVRIPLGAFTCVSGVSGSGKSSLIVDTLLPEAQRQLNGANAWGLPHERLDGLERLDKVIFVDQSPLGRSARSNAATYTGVLTDLRNLYANTREAKVRGYGPSRFSFNVKGGRCEVCQGEGVRRIDMQFLPDVHVRCGTCQGRRYNRETLRVTYRGRHIADALDMSVAEACEFFFNIPGLRAKLEVLRDVGLGYLRLGQSASSLSGGEAQRIKLARELARKSTGATLFVLDEPTSGLHVHDVRKLIEVFDRLVDEGNTVVVIEHDLDVLKNADWLIDLGPDGGVHGGTLVAQGTPEAVIDAAPEAHTARFLAPMLTDR